MPPIFGNSSSCLLEHQMKRIAVQAYSVIIITPEQQNQMAQQNPWKKQMLANKNKNQTTTPISANNNATTPPWIKNNQANTNNTPTTPAVNSWIKNNPPAENTANTPPWVKNNSSVVTAPQSPKVDSPKPVVGGGTAPWMKPKEELNTGNTVSWAKNAVNSSPSNNPPWSKGGSNAPEPTATTPSWANKGGSSPSQPNWASKTGAESPSNPPWMKKQDSGSQPQPGNNSWKLKQMADIEKQKKEREEKNRLLEEQEKQRKKQQKLKKQKEAEELNTQRELQMMSKEDKHSANREKFEKQMQERIQREKKEKEEQEKLKRERKQAEERQQQRIILQKEKQEKLQKEKQQQQRLQKERLEQQKLQRLENSKSKSKSVKKSKRGNQLQTSKISHISSIKGNDNQHSSSINAFEVTPTTERDPSQPQNLFHRYTRLMNEECSEADYRSKIVIQKQIVQTQLQFKRECQKEILSLLDKKKVTNRKRKIVFSNNMQIRYGLCEGRKGQKGLQFHQQESQKLRSIFLYYEAVTKCIVSLLKKKINTHFRVPLLNLAEYKGITFLVEYTCEELVDINEIDIGLFQEITNEVLILQKELQLCYDSRNNFLKPLTRNQLMVKKVNIYEEDYYILYIKEELVEGNKGKVESKGKTPTLLPGLSYLKLIEYITGEAHMLPFYSPPLLPGNRELNDKIASPATKNLLKEISLANAVCTVYSSCQGEVQENSFFQLVVGQNKEMWDMIALAGFPQKQTPSPIALSYLQNLASLRFNFTPAFYTRKQKQMVQSVTPRVYIQKHEFQMLEFARNLEKYITEDKEELVEESMRLNRELWEEMERSQVGAVQVLKIKQEVSYLLYRQRGEQALQVLAKYQERVGSHSVENISISMLFIKIYVRTDAEVKLLMKLSQLLQLLEFYFKEETILHSYVYTIVGSYYSKQGDEPKVLTFYQHAINIVLKLYGEKAQEVAEIYLSRASAMLSLHKLDAFQRDMTLALRIYKMHSKNNSKIAQCNYLLGKVSCLQGKLAEGLELMASSSALFLKLQNYIESLNVSFELLHFLQGDEQRFELQLQRIVDICFRHKSVWAFRKVVKLLLDRELQCYTSLTVASLLQLYTGEEQQRSNQEILIDLEQEIKGFTSFIEIVRWSLSILAAKVVARKETTSDYWKALNIMKQVIHFYKPSQSQPISQLQ